MKRMEGSLTLHVENGLDLAVMRQSGNMNMELFVSSLIATHT
jgi:hypothetical protein